ncbi:hypothetical protein B0J14DRAFT_649227 [Halenospora varia]|nr:hypothetical protein B0J14DRAFT_649227 [Halenospora varia]
MAHHCTKCSDKSSKVAPIPEFTSGPAYSIKNRGEPENFYSLLQREAPEAPEEFTVGRAKAATSRREEEELQTKLRGGGWCAGFGLAKQEQNPVRLGPSIESKKELALKHSMQEAKKVRSEAEQELGSASVTGFKYCGTSKLNGQFLRPEGVEEVKKSQLLRIMKGLRHPRQLFGKRKIMSMDNRKFEIESFGPDGPGGESICHKVRYDQKKGEGKGLATIPIPSPRLFNTEPHFPMDSEGASSTAKENLTSQGACRLSPGIVKMGQDLERDMAEICKKKGIRFAFVSEEGNKDMPVPETAEGAAELTLRKAKVLRDYLLQEERKVKEAHLKMTVHILEGLLEEMGKECPEIVGKEEDRDSTGEGEILPEPAHIPHRPRFDFAPVAQALEAAKEYNEFLDAIEFQYAHGIQHDYEIDDPAFLVEIDGHLTKFLKGTRKRDMVTDEFRGKNGEVDVWDCFVLGSGNGWEEVEER